VLEGAEGAGGADPEVVVAPVAVRVAVAARDPIHGVGGRGIEEAAPEAEVGHGMGVQIGHAPHWTWLIRGRHRRGIIGAANVVDVDVSPAARGGVHDADSAAQVAELRGVPGPALEDLAVAPAGRVPNDVVAAADVDEGPGHFGAHGIQLGEELDPGVGGGASSDQEGDGVGVQAELLRGEGAGGRVPAQPAPRRAGIGPGLERADPVRALVVDGARPLPVVAAQRGAVPEPPGGHVRAVGGLPAEGHALGGPPGQGPGLEVPASEVAAAAGRPGLAGRGRVHGTHRRRRRRGGRRRHGAWAGVGGGGRGRIEHRRGGRLLPATAGHQRQQRRSSDGHKPMVEGEAHLLSFRRPRPRSPGARWPGVVQPRCPRTGRRAPTCAGCRRRDVTRSDDDACRRSTSSDDLVIAHENEVGPRSAVPAGHRFRLAQGRPEGIG
jgi:hypothetical protein